MSDLRDSSSAAAPVTDGVAKATKPNGQRGARGAWNDSHRRIVQEVFHAGRQAQQASTTCRIIMPDGTVVEASGCNKYSEKSSTAGEQFKFSVSS